MPAVYDKLASGYDRAFKPLDALGLTRLRRETLGLLPVDGTILEVGAGTGANFQHYPHCKLAIASEFSIKMLEIAAGKASSIHLVQANAEILPFPANHFDAAFATLVFCSIPDPAMAFTELRRVVKPGGRIILLEHVRPDGILGPVFDLINVASMAIAEDHFNRRTAATAAEAGLKVVEVRKKLLSIVNLIVCEVD
ncbi:MAG: methyltransferase domain-containing protein [Pyrinomonadaceae bacterium]